MTKQTNQIKSLTTTLFEFLKQEEKACQEQILSIIELIKNIQGSSADRRLQRLNTQLKELREHLNLLIKILKEDFVAKINFQIDELNEKLSDNRLIKILTELFQTKPLSLKQFCQTLLENLIKLINAEKGLIVSYLPESTEANIIAAYNFQTTNLIVEEYSFSRTLLREVFESQSPLLLENVSLNPTYSKEESVRKYQLKSIIVLPLKYDERVIGAFYLANDEVPSAFNKGDLALLETIASFTISYFHHSRMLPIVFEQGSKVILDSNKASKEIIGQDKKMLSLLEIINQVADTNASVLIQGESGCGKELLARALHFQSSRRQFPFIAINCAAIPENLLESELFGYERGAFTGAFTRYAGHIQQSDGGTIFLDEIGDLAFSLQAKMLRFLQSNEFRRLGAKETTKVDVRIVAATSRDLKKMIELGEFQKALYYRLNVVPLEVPPLRERKSDIVILTNYFLEKFSAIYKRTIYIAPEANEWLKEYDFPGNVRELENMVHRMVVLNKNNLIEIKDLPQEILEISLKLINLKRDPLYITLQNPPTSFQDLQYRREELNRLLSKQERLLIEQTVKEANNNLTEAANRLGIHRVTLHRILRKTKN
ncbi:MAG: sigma-54-dependent Fis family transcriptional regulator [Acidobacteria bacterium]|nr:sigma-54-dependent Fis family transcriptional regulator [Acidobacteriota bacterium]